MSDSHAPRRLRHGAIALGVALGGFFDGILLHQILQWHHLLSAIQTGPFGDLRWQVMADGMFHAAMYLVAVVGGVTIWRGRRALAVPGASKRVVTGLLIGFGAWHVIDAVVSHWLTGLHRVRMDVGNPLAWDLAWFAVFGVLPILIALYVERRAPGLPRRAAPPVAMLAIVIAAGGAWLHLFPVGADASVVTVVMRPGKGLADLGGALDRADARVLWSDAAGGVWVLRTLAQDRTVDWYRHGAMWVSGGAGVTSCADWLRPGV